VKSRTLAKVRLHPSMGPERTFPERLRIAAGILGTTAGVLPNWTAHRGDVRYGGRPHGQSSTEADGRRVSSAEFKRTTVQRLLTGEKTVASVIRNWARRSEAGAATAVEARSQHGTPSQGF
jgi:hypothetical protein